MKEFLIDFFVKAGFVAYIKPTIILFIVTMGMVYGFGKMLNIVKTSVGKNRIAFLTCAIFGPLEMLGYVTPIVEVCLVILSLGIMVYTLFGMRLFYRVDKFQDEKFAEDDYVEPKKPVRPARQPVKQTKPKKAKK